MPFISVIIPVYNSENFIAECIKSIVKQTFLNWELIIVDDGSTDTSLKICQQYASEDNRIVPNNKDKIVNFHLAIENLIENSNYRHELALTAVQNSKRFTVDTIGQKWIELFKKLNSASKN